MDQITREHGDTHLKQARTHAHTPNSNFTDTHTHTHTSYIQLNNPSDIRTCINIHLHRTYLTGDSVASHGHLVVYTHVCTHARGYVDHVLHQGAEQARSIAEVNMREISRIVGFS